MAKATVEFVGEDAGLDGTIDQYADRLEGLASTAGVIGGAVGGTVAFGLEKAFDTLEAAVGFLADSIYEALKRNKEWTRAMSDLDSSWSGLMDNIASATEGLTIFYDALAVAIEGLNGFTDSIGEFIETATGGLGKEWDTGRTGLLDAYVAKSQRRHRELGFADQDVFLAGDLLQGQNELRNNRSIHSASVFEDIDAQNIANAMLSIEAMGNLAESFGSTAETWAASFGQMAGGVGRNAQNALATGNWNSEAVAKAFGATDGVEKGFQAEMVGLEGMYSKIQTAVASTEDKVVENTKKSAENLEKIGKTVVNGALKVFGNVGASFQ